MLGNRPTNQIKLKNQENWNEKSNNRGKFNKIRKNGEVREIVISFFNQNFYRTGLSNKASMQNMYFWRN